MCVFSTRMTRLLRRLGARRKGLRRDDASQQLDTCPHLAEHPRAVKELAEAVAERERRIADRVLQRRGDVRLDKRQHIHGVRLDVAAAPQPLDARKAVETRLLDATEGQALAHVRHAEVVDAAHARVELLGDAPAARGALREDVGAQAKVAVVGQRHRLLIAAHLDDGKHRPEDLLLHDAHGVVHVAEHGGRVELPLTLGQLAAHVAHGALGDGVLHQRMHARGRLRHAHGAAVHRAAAHGGPLAQLPGDGHHLAHEALVHALVHVEAFGARAVLAARLEGATERSGHDLHEVGVIAHDERVLAAQLQHHRRERLRSALHDHAPHGGAAHEDHLVAPARHHRFTRLAVARHDLHQVLGRAGRLQRGLNDAAVVLRAPRAVLGHLDHQRVAREEVGHQRVEDVMEGVVPRYNGAHHAHRPPLDPRALVEDHAPRRAALRSQPALALIDEPRDLLAGGQHLAEGGIHQRLARVARCHAADGGLVGHDEALQHTQQLAALREAGACPLLLRLSRARDALLHLLPRHGLHGAQRAHCGWIVARDLARRARIALPRESLSAQLIGRLELARGHGEQRRVRGLAQRAPQQPMRHRRQESECELVRQGQRRQRGPRGRGQRRERRGQRLCRGGRLLRRRRHWREFIHGDTRGV
mmetsp:Transcript_22765/g.70331  ORF Transcript_22765/g.70331 Transcript_22765/m.70331 type:complete len:646 (-) Transcript_22765:53-1990(-)